MYQDLRKKQTINIVIDVKSLEQSCGGCPTIYDFKDEEGINYYFRLRHGYARLDCEDTDETLCEGEMTGFDGVCNWDEMVDWVLKQGVKINY